MIILRKRTADFYEKYKDRFEKIENELQYWKLLLLCLKEEEFISEDSYWSIQKLLQNKENGIISEENKISSIQKKEVLRKLMERFSEHERVFREKNTVHERFENIRKKKYGEKYEKWEEEHIKRIFDNSNKYLILYQIYESKYEYLKQLREKKAFYYRYGKTTVLNGDYYCPSAIEDIITNGRRGKLLKHVPKDKCDKVEYIYDEQGRLIMWRYLNLHGVWTNVEYLLYAQDSIISILFEWYSERYKINSISIRNYKNDKVIDYEWVYFYVEDWKSGFDCFRLQPEATCGKYLLEEYKYKEEGPLEECKHIKYYYPKVKLYSGQEIRYESKGMLYEAMGYKFYHNDEKKLIEYLAQDLFGGDDDKTFYYKLNDKEIESTDMKSGRWRMPNYFVEME